MCGANTGTMLIQCRRLIDADSNGAFGRSSLGRPVRVVADTTTLAPLATQSAPQTPTDAPKPLPARH